MSFYLSNFSSFTRTLIICVETIFCPQCCSTDALFLVRVHLLIWEWHLGALLSLSSHHTCIYTFSPTRHWDGITITVPFHSHGFKQVVYDLNTAPPMSPPICYISDHCSGSLSTSSLIVLHFWLVRRSWTNAIRVLLTYKSVSTKRAPPISVGSGVSKTMCGSILKGGYHWQTCSSLASGERERALFLTLAAWHQLSLGWTSQVFFFPIYPTS